MAFKKWQEERDADLAADEARRVEQVAQNTARLAERRAQAMWDAFTPWEKASAAFDRGDTFLQLELPHSSVTGSATLMDPAAVGTIERAGTPQDTLGKVEAAGWRLQHASWVFVETGQTSRDKMLSSGQRTVINGEVVGMYLFRRGDAAHPANSN